MPGDSGLTLGDLLARQAARIPDAPAILAPGRAPLTYKCLQQHVGETGRALRAMGVGRGDRIALVLPNGPEMAAAVVAVSARTACAPLNPALGAGEVDRLLEALRPRALVTRAGMDSPARRVALARMLPIIELSAAPEVEAGVFELAGDCAGGASPAGTAWPHENHATDAEDVALLLLTSGTTAQAKIVPLTHRNVRTSACWWRDALALTNADRCVNVLPLFHGHGLIATLMASLEAGASIVCTPGCEPGLFFTWLGEFCPTWYSAVPTMHQAIVSEAGRRGGVPAEFRLRFVRSASAPLPIAVLTELERTFQTPVIEFYGMTETASAPIACNPLPPGRRKPGSVGIRVGLEVSVIDGEEGPLAPGRTGEVAVRGPSVMHGYDGEPAAGHSAGANGWFKTGDLGYFDADGYLFLAGRSKEIINRGGEKISPREVDDVLLGHPAVAEAVTFPMPHATLGEDVAAAVVLRSDARVTAGDIRRFAVGRLAAFKIPRQILVVPELPTGPTGKVHRASLAATFGLLEPMAPDAAVVDVQRTPFEDVVASLWSQLLDLERVGIHDDFFALGGDSLLATQMLAQVRDAVRVEVSFPAFFETPTVAGVAREIEALMRAGAGTIEAIAPVPRDTPLPISIPQERLWGLEQLLPGMPFFNILHALWLTGRLDAAILEASLDEIVRRHEALRTTVSVLDGRPVGRIAPAMPVPLAGDDLTSLSESEKETRGHRLVGEEALRPFDLARGPLLRARLLHWADEEHLLILTTHQLVADGWSLGVLGDELAALYDAFAAGRPSPLPALPIQYADYAAWQRDWPARPATRAQLGYWREQLRGPLSRLELFSDHPRPGLGLRTARMEVALPDTLAHAIQRFARREGGTVFMVLVAAFKMLVHGYLGQDDVRVATPVANRHHPGTDALIGPLANTVILRTDLGGDPTALEVLRRVRDTTLSAYANQDVPLEELARALQCEREFQPAALAPMMMVLQSAGLRRRARSGRTLGFREAYPGMLVPLVPATAFDLVLMLDESPDGLSGSCVYKSEVLDGATVARLLADFQFVLDGLVRQPQQPLSAVRRALHEPGSDSRRGGA